MKNLKLYVWEDADCGAYYPGLIFAYAKTLKEAKGLILKKAPLDKDIEKALQLKPSVYKTKATCSIHYGGD